METGWVDGRYPGRTQGEAGRLAVVCTDSLDDSSPDTRDRLGRGVAGRGVSRNTVFYRLPLSFIWERGGGEEGRCSSLLDVAFSLFPQVILGGRLILGMQSAKVPVCPL